MPRVRQEAEAASGETGDKGAEMSLSKKLRFEIFKRDSFTCQYCGKTPPDVILHVDHIHPVAHGGGDDPMNLITACSDCNLGKGAREITAVSPRPDADLEWLARIAALRRYQVAKEERDRLAKTIVRALQETWSVHFSDDYVPTDTMLYQWLSWAEPSQIEDAIKRASSKSYRIRSFSDRLRYTAGILHNIVDNEG
jgi:hypothetical protein